MRLLIAFGLLLASASPALAAPLIDLDRVQAVARQEGLPLATIRLAGPHRLQLASAEALPRAAFLKRAGLLAFVVFKRLPSKVQEIEFSNSHAGGEQACRIARKDFDAYMKDAIPKAEYERRLSYRERGHVVTAAVPHAALPPLPALPGLQPPTPPRGNGFNLPSISLTSGPNGAPAAPAASTVAAVARPGLATLMAFSYGLALGGGRFDAYQVEYGHPILETLDLRPSVQMISAFSPLNYMAGASRQTDGLSFACDLLGTTRQHPGVAGLAFEGGLGARVASMQGATAGTWPALHLRAGLRWGPLALGVRYPMLKRDLDPTGTWEANVGLSVPFSTFGGK